MSRRRTWKPSTHRFGILLGEIQIRDRLLTSKQVAERIGVKEQTLATWRFRRDPRLRWVHYAKRTILYRKSVVDKFLEQCGGQPEQ